MITIYANNTITGLTDAPAGTWFVVQRQDRTVLRHTTFPVSNGLLNRVDADYDLPLVRYSLATDTPNTDVGGCAQFKIDAEATMLNIVEGLEK